MCVCVCVCVCLVSQVERYDDELKLAKAELDTITDVWLPTLKRLVEQINERFSDNFQQIACAGEVTLTEPEDDKYKFDEYAITIR